MRDMSTSSEWEGDEVGVEKITPLISPISSFAGSEGERLFAPNARRPEEAS